jgi:hypothetical protein
MFSKHKLNILKNNKLKKYLFYAFGEIVLIVIGISIAVFINNKVEKNKQDRLFKTILVNISNDLETDLEEVDIVLKAYEDQEDLFSYVLDSLDAGKSIKNCIYCPQVLTSAIPFTLRTRGYLQLSSYKEDNLNSTDSLVFDLSNFYNSYLKTSEVVNKLLLDDTHENLNYLKVNYPHFKYLFTDKNIEGRMDFFENNTEFVNRVALREILNYANHVQLLESYKKDASGLLEDIKAELKFKK